MRNLFNLEGLSQRELFLFTVVPLSHRPEIARDARIHLGLGVAVRAKRLLPR